MLVLGIDPGTAICGYGLVDMTGNRLRPVFYGSVLTDKDMLPELRLKKIYDDISDIIEHFKPDLLSIEKLFFQPQRDYCDSCRTGTRRCAFGCGQQGTAGDGIYADAD